MFNENKRLPYAKQIGSIWNSDSDSKSATFKSKVLIELDSNLNTKLLKFRIWTQILLIQNLLIKSDLKCNFSIHLSVRWAASRQSSSVWNVDSTLWTPHCRAWPIHPRALFGRMHTDPCRTACDRSLLQSAPMHFRTFRTIWALLFGL